MAVTDDERLADRMRLMSLHGLSKDAWTRYSGGAARYDIVAPGFKYNMTDVAAALGVTQLARADALWHERQRLARAYTESLAGLPGLVLPRELEHRRHSWHLYPVRVRAQSAGTNRDGLVEQLTARGIATSLHWKPLHLHPYYERSFGYARGDFPVAERAFDELVSLPLFVGMTAEEQHEVVAAVSEILTQPRA
jgi:perosamine synthetase